MTKPHKYPIPNWETKAHTPLHSLFTLTSLSWLISFLYFITLLLLLLFLFLSFLPPLPYFSPQDCVVTFKSNSPYLKDFLKINNFLNKKKTSPPIWLWPFWQKHTRRKGATNNWPTLNQTWTIAIGKKTFNKWLQQLPLQSIRQQWLIWQIFHHP